MSEPSNAKLTPFLRLPAEVRLIIYELLLSNHNDQILRIRTEDAATYERRKQEHRQRSKFRYIEDRMRSRSSESTYCLVKSQGLHPSILGVDRQVHREASHVLYSCTFDFGMDIECIVPFLQDLTPTARSSIKRIKMVKRSLPYTKDFDRCEWRNACDFISKNLDLVQLDLGVYGGTPSLANRPALHWKQDSTYTKADFAMISKLQECEADMEWAKQVTAIGGLQVLNVNALLEHCPIPGSRAMAFFVNFSASIEEGFTEYLRSHMVAQSS